MLIFKPEPKSLTLELQQPIVSRPLLRIAEEGIGVDNLPESQQSIRVACVEVGMGRLTGQRPVSRPGIGPAKLAVSVPRLRVFRDSNPFVWFVWFVDKSYLFASISPAKRSKR